MPLDRLAVHVLGVHSDESLADERLAQQRPVAIPKCELSVRFLVGVGTHVHGAADDHLPEHVAFDVGPAPAPCGQGSGDRRLARGLSTDHDDGTRGFVHDAILSLTPRPAARVSADGSDQSGSCSGIRDLSLADPPGRRSRDHGVADPLSGGLRPGTQRRRIEAVAVQHGRGQDRHPPELDACTLAATVESASRKRSRSALWRGPAVNCGQSRGNQYSGECSASIAQTAGD